MGREAIVQRKAFARGRVGGRAVFVNGLGWLWWIGIALVAGVVEVLTVDLIFVMIAAGAFAAGLASLAGASVAISIVVFCVVALLGLFAVRPIALRRIRNEDASHQTNADALIGRSVETLSDVTSRGGQVKLAGEVWSARAAGMEQVPAGQEAFVVRLEGATAIVSLGRPDAGPPPDSSGYGRSGRNDAYGSSRGAGESDYPDPPSSPYDYPSR